MVELVKCITDSDVGVSELDKIYTEAEASGGEGRGDTLKSVWNNDVDMFFADQQKNGEFVFPIGVFCYLHVQ